MPRIRVKNAKDCELDTGPSKKHLESSHRILGSQRNLGACWVPFSFDVIQEI